MRSKNKINEEVVFMCEKSGCDFIRVERKSNFKFINNTRSQVFECIFYIAPS